MAITNNNFDSNVKENPISKVDFESAGLVNDYDVAFTDIATGNASITKHGYQKKLPNVATQYADGTGNYSVPAGTPLDINSLTAKTTPVDADITVIEDSAASFAKKKLSWTNIKATLKTYFDTLYASLAGFNTGATDNAIIRANGTGGASLQTSGITIDDSNNIVLPTIVAAEQKGIIYKGATRFIHTYKPTTGGFGDNIFIGLNAGNFTMTAAGASDAGANVGIGQDALVGLTGGSGGAYQNVGIGYKALTSLTSGTNNFGCGTHSFRTGTTFTDNAGVGSESGRYMKGNANTAFGTQALKGGSGGTSTGGTNSAFGFQTLVLLTTGSNNVAIGYRANDICTTGARNITIGADQDPSGAGVNDEMNIGGVLYGKVQSASVKGIGVGITANNITAWLHIAAGTATASTAPLKFTSGTLLTAAEAGAVEFLTDKGYLTITTGTARKELTLNDVALTSGRVPFATTNGRLTDDADMTFAVDTLSVTKFKCGANGYIASDSSVGASGTFTTVDLKTVTCKDGLVVSIV